MSDEKIVQIITGRLLLPTERTVDRSQDKNLCSAVRLLELPNSCGKTSSDTACRENCNNIMIDCQVKCNKINEKIYKALRGEYENQGVYGDDY